MFKYHKETSFFINALHKEPTVPGHLVLFFLPQHPNINIHLKIEKLIKRRCIFSKWLKCFSNKNQHNVSTTFTLEYCMCRNTKKTPAILQIKSNWLTPRMLEEQHNTSPWRPYFSLSHSLLLLENPLQLTQNLNSKTNL